MKCTHFYIDFESKKIHFTLELKLNLDFALIAIKFVEIIMIQQLHSEKKFFPPPPSLV